MMPVDAFFRQNNIPFHEDNLRRRETRAYPNPLFTISNEGAEEDEPEEVCPCCVDSNTKLDKGNKNATKIVNNILSNSNIGYCVKAK